MNFLGCWPSDKKQVRDAPRSRYSRSSLPPSRPAMRPVSSHIQAAAMNHHMPYPSGQGALHYPMSSHMQPLPFQMQSQASQFASSSMQRQFPMMQPQYATSSLQARYPSSSVVQHMGAMRPNFPAPGTPCLWRPQTVSPALEDTRENLHGANEYLAHNAEENLHGANECLARNEFENNLHLRNQAPPCDQKETPVVQEDLLKDLSSREKYATLIHQFLPGYPTSQEDVPVIQRPQVFSAASFVTQMRPPPCRFLAPEKCVFGVRTTEAEFPRAEVPEMGTEEYWKAQEENGLISAGESDSVSSGASSVSDESEEVVEFEKSEDEIQIQERMNSGQYFNREYDESRIIGTENTEIENDMEVEDAAEEEHSVHVSETKYLESSFKHLISDEVSMSLPIGIPSSALDFPGDEEARDSSDGDSDLVASPKPKTQGRLETCESEQDGIVIRESSRFEMTTTEQLEDECEEAEEGLLSLRDHREMSERIETQQTEGSALIEEDIPFITGSSSEPFMESQLSHQDVQPVRRIERPERTSSIECEATKCDLAARRTRTHQPTKSPIKMSKLPKFKDNRTMSPGAVSVTSRASRAGFFTERTTTSRQRRKDEGDNALEAAIQKSRAALLDYRKTAPHCYDFHVKDEIKLVRLEKLGDSFGAYTDGINGGKVMALESLLQKFMKN